MRIFITGASGFVGGAIANHLKRDHTVSGLARSEAAGNRLREHGVEVVTGDLTSVRPEDLRGQEVVIHCAAHVKEWGTYQEFHRINVEGTRALLAASRASGVRRFIFIGTEAAFFDGRDLVGIDESIKYPARLPYAYSQTKAEAEQAVLSANDQDFQTISLRPRFVWGPGDQSILPVLVDMVQNGRFAWIAQGRFQISSTYIANLVHAVELALTRGRGGEAYFIADEGAVEMREFLTAALETQGVTPPSRSLPKSVVRTAARIVEAMWRMFGLRGKPPITRFSADMMSANCTVDISKAKRELNYRPPVSREEGLSKMTEVSR